MADDTPAQITVRALKEALLSRHPWYDAMMLDDLKWPLTRAVMGGFADRAVKERFLTKGAFENNYPTRVSISHFLGKTEGIASSFTGAVFLREPEIDYMPTSEDAKPIDPSAPVEPPPLGPMEQALSAWGDDVDGQGSSITELLETNSDEAITMGLVGYYVTKPSLTEAQQAALAAAKATPGLANADGVLPKDVVRKLGANKPARVRKFGAEQITNWDCDSEGRLLWVILTQEVTRQADPLTKRETLCQWIVLTRTEAIVYEAPLAIPTVVQDPSGLGVAVAPLPQNTAQPVSHHTGTLQFPVTEGQVGDPVETARATHNLNMVPFVISYGGGKRIASQPLQVQALMDGAKRADLSHFNFWSWFAFAFMLHNSPVLELITDRKIGDVIRDLSRAFVLKPSTATSGAESVNYKSTPSESFDSSMSALESLSLDTYRQAGAEPVGMFERGGAKAESGVAKQVRHKNTEARALARVSKDASAAHFDLLEIGARYLMPRPPDIDTMAFAGSVRYAQQFDLDDVAELIDQYLKAGPKVKSIHWHRGMLKRIALLSRGEISASDRGLIEAEIDKLAEEDLFPPVAQIGPNGEQIFEPSAAGGADGPPQPGKKNLDGGSPQKETSTAAQKAA